MLTQTPQERWISRALRAEVELFRAGLRPGDPRSVYSDDAWLVATFTHKDGSAPHVDELIAARARLAQG
jgi:hypothetical protein